MKYSRREMLGFAAAGMAAAATPVVFRDTAQAVGTTAYDQAKADAIHEDSVHRAIIEAGDDPAAVREQVLQRTRLLA